MKLTTGAVFFALSGAALAAPLPTGVLDNVQDDCTGKGPGCVSAGPFLHHMTDSESKYLHLIHPETGAVTHAPLSSLKSLPTSSYSSSSAGQDYDQGISGDSSMAGMGAKMTGNPSMGGLGGMGGMGGGMTGSHSLSSVYPSNNHPATTNPFRGPPPPSGTASQLPSDPNVALDSSISPNATTAITPGSGPGGSGSKPVSLMDADFANVDDLEDLSMKPDGNAVSPNATTAPLHGVPSNQNPPITPPPNSSDIKAPLPNPMTAPPNSTQIADATGVAQAPNLLSINGSGSVQKVN